MGKSEVRVLFFGFLEKIVKNHFLHRTIGFLQQSDKKRGINMAQPSNAVNVLIHDANGKGLLQKPLTQCSIFYIFFCIYDCRSLERYIHKPYLHAVLWIIPKQQYLLLHLLYFPRFLISKENDGNILMQFNQYNRRLEFAWLRNCSEFALSLLLIANVIKREDTL